jgi:hypothetical protein
VTEKKLSDPRQMARLYRLFFGNRPDLMKPRKKRQPLKPEEGGADEPAPVLK